MEKELQKRICEVEDCDREKTIEFGDARILLCSLHFEKLSSGEKLLIIHQT